MRELSPSECRQCGTCCQKSSPTLHPTDADLFFRGGLSLADVYTLRKGEFVFDNISGSVARLEEEHIKIGERPGTRICRYLGADGSTCRIYDSRPAQCRTLECWNPDPLVALYDSSKLERQALIRDKSIKELVLHHEERTSFARLTEGIQALALGGPEEPILDILNFDLYIRDFVMERSLLEPDVLPFHFGRPMIQCLSGFGYRLEGDRGRGYVLVSETGNRPSRPDPGRV